MSWLRKPKTTQERRWAIDGWNRPKRSNHRLPEAWDDIYKNRYKCWKNYRKTQYRVITVR